MPQAPRMQHAYEDMPVTAPSHVELEILANSQTERYDLGVAYVGHAERWGQVEIDGQLEERDCTLTYRRAGKKLAVAVIHRDLEGLRAEVDFERAIAAPQVRARLLG